MKTRPIALLSAISMVASLLIAAPLPAAAANDTVYVTDASALKTEVESGTAAVIVIGPSPGQPVLYPILIEITQPITVGRNVTIRGAASTAEATTLEVTGNSPALIITSGNVTLERFAITGANDRRASGGAVSVHSGATLNMTQMSVHNNFAGEGGGLYNAGTTYVYDSVFYANEVPGKGGAINNAGTLEVWNSTFASNDAGQGGAISSAGDAYLHFVTIVGNSSKNKIGAGTHLNGGNIEIYDSIVANNFSGGSFYDCSGQTPVSYVLFSSTQGCQPSGVLGTDYLVVTDLTFDVFDGSDPKYIGREYPFDNGGPTKTVALLDQDALTSELDHPAVGFGNGCTDGAQPRNDQRGVERPDPCAVGAYEPDTTPPTVTITPDSDTWSKTPVTVSIAADDGVGSGVATLVYEATGADSTDGSIMVSGATTTYTVDANGPTDIQAWATDFDGNTGTAGPVVVKVDQLAPTVTPTVNIDKTVSFVVTDAHSGVESLFVNDEPVTLDEYGQSDPINCAGLCVFVATDHAVNETSGTIDVEDPLVTITPAVDPDGDNDWYISDVSVEVDAVDNTGVASLTFAFSHQAGSVNTTDNPFIVVLDGVTTVTGTATDTSGNTGSATPLLISLDKAEPSVVAEIIDTDPTTGFVTVRLAPSDATSGVDRIKHKADPDETVAQNLGQNATLVQDPGWVDVVIKDSGTTYLSYQAWDKAGNPSAIGTIQVVIVGPEIALTLDASSDFVPAGAVSATIDDITASLQAVVGGGASVSSTPFGSIPFGSIDVRDNPFGSIPFGSIPFGSIGVDNLPFGSIPFGSISPDSTPFGSIPFGSIPFGSIDFDVAPFGSIPFGSIPFGSIPFGSILLSELSTADGQSMDFYLQGITGFEGAPLQTLAFGDLLNVPFGSIDLNVNPFGSISVGAVPFGSIGLDPNTFIDCTAFDSVFGPDSLYPTPVTCSDINPFNPDLPTLAEIQAEGVSFTGTFGDVLGLDDVNFSSTALSFLPFGSILLGPLTLGDLPFGSIDGGFTLGNIAGWCDALGADVCAEFGITTTDNGQSLLSLALGGVDIGQVPFGSIGLDGIPFGSIPFGSIPFGSIDWNSVPFGSIAGVPDGICDDLLAESIVADASDCSSLSILDAYTAGAQLSSATLADLEGWAGLNGFSLADLLIGFFPPAEVPWLEASNLNALRLPEADTTQPSFDYVIGISIANLQSTANVELELPPGFVPKYDTADADWTLDPLPFTETYGAPLESGESPIVLTFEGLDLPIGDYEITVPVWAGVVLGSAVAYANGSITSESSPVTALEVSKTVVVEQALGSTGFPPLLQGSGCSADSNLEIAHIVDASDVEVYEFTVPVDCAGARLEALLTNLEADLDLVLFGPKAADYLRGTPLASSPYVEDHEYDLNPDDSFLDAEALADINLDTVSLGIPSSSVPIAVSANRDLADEGFDVRTPVAGGTYQLAVIGFNGATSDFPFGLQARLRGSAASTCSTCGDSSWTAGGTLPDPNVLGGGANTLFLYNAGWLGDNQGSLITILSDPEWSTLGVNGIAVPVDGSDAPIGIDVRGQMAEWYGNNEADRNVSANDVVREIGELIDWYVASNPGIEYVVIIGDDQAIPFARVVDSTFYSNETDHAPAIPIDGDLKQALGGGFILSDDPYGSGPGIAYADTEFFVPTIAVGRLVEDWGQIETQLNAFLLRDGVLDRDSDPNTYAAAAGYDFLRDGVQEIVANLEAGGYSFSTATGPRILNEQSGDYVDGALWSDVNLEGLLAESPAATVASLNMHFDQYRALPSANNASGNESTGLFTVEDVLSIADTVLFSMGCHSGLNVSDFQVGAGSGAWSNDWAQATTANGNLWIGNTGFGYGDSVFVAYSEALSASFSQYAGDHPIGTAWSLAKQDYASDLFVVSPYHVKALNEWVLYGLPMYRTHDSVPILSATVAAAALDGPTLLPDPRGSALQFASASLNQAEIGLVDQGGYFAASGGSLEIRGRASVALAEKDMTAPDGFEAAGVIVTGLTSRELESYQATIVNPVIDTPDGFGVGPNESLRYPAPRATFPAGIARLVDGVGPDGSPTALAQFAASRFDPDATDPNPQDGYSGTMELFESFDFEVYYRPIGETDRTPPRVPLALGVSDGDIAYFEITAIDAANEVHRVNVLFGPASRTSGVKWTSVELVKVGTTNRWVGGVPIDESWPESGTDFAFWGQVCDNVGNCDAFTAKGVYHNTTDAGNEDFVTITVNGDGPTGVWYKNIGSVVMTAALTGGADIDRYIIDGVEYAGGQSPFSASDDALSILNQDRAHYILAYDNQGGSPGARLIAVDGTDPIVSIDSPADGAAFAANADEVATFSCSDALSGVASCEASIDDGPTWVSGGSIILDTATTGAHTVTARATDNAGNLAETSITYSVIDGTPPVVVITSPNDGDSFELGDSGSITFSCDDPDTGITSCEGELSVNGGAFAPLPTTQSGDTYSALLQTDVIGTYTIRVSGVNGDGLTATAARTYLVGYHVCLDYKPNKAQPSSGAVPIKLFLCDAAGNNLSSESIVLTADSILREDTGGEFFAGPNDTGSANEDFLFRFTTDRYNYNLNTTETTDALGNPKPLVAGNFFYIFRFTVSTTPGILYQARFKLK